MRRMITFGQNMVSLGQPISFMTKQPLPVVTAVPFISVNDDPVVAGNQLTYVPGEYAGPVTLTWAWFSDADQVQDGGEHYIVLESDVGKEITIFESATNPRGTIVTQTDGVLVS